MAAVVPRTAALWQVELAPVALVTRESPPSVETAWRTWEARRTRRRELHVSAERWAAAYVLEGRSAAAAVVSLVPSTLAVGCR